QVFESMAAFNGTGDYVVQPAGAEAQIVRGDHVTASFFEVLRAKPMLGALFTSANEIAGSDRVVVVSHGFWRRHLGGDPAAIGRTLTLNDRSYTVVGVMPAEFAYPPGAPLPGELWTPWVHGPQDRAASGGGARQLGGTQSIARLRPGVSLEQARAQMSQVAATTAIDPASKTPITRRGVGVRLLRDHLVGSSTRSWMLMLLTAVGMVLLIASANVANLWLARASIQERDAAVRAALGASRGRLVQRVLLESLTVSAAGTLAGLALAWWGVRVAAAALPESVSRVAAIGINARVIAVAAMVAVATAVVSGLSPALQGSRPVLSNVLAVSAPGG